MPSVADVFGQGDFSIRLDWGPVGAAEMQADVCVVVDVLSFSTSVTIAVERGMTVFPYRWKGPLADEFARINDAVLAVGRLEASAIDRPPPPSLSPAALLGCAVTPRIVLPSPNGSTICVLLQDSGAEILIGSLRNASAVASQLAYAVRAGASVGLVAAGERWGADGSLRPALEDHLGAGAIVSHLRRLGVAEGASPEAVAAADLFDASRADLRQRLHACVGGRELTGKGFASDVDAAADLDASMTVPVLVEGAFVAGTAPDSAQI